MARPRSAGYDDQRELILARAAHLFAQRGYPGTSMNEVAEACGMSKASLYHYFRDKDDLLVSIADGHVARLEALVDQVLAAHPPGEGRARALIERFVEEYADAQNAHRVLTDDVRFLPEATREAILARERRVVDGFAQTIAELKPALGKDGLSKPLAMLLFGMINWMFTWLRPDGALTHADMGPIVADLFFGGVGAVKAPGKAKPRAAAQRGAKRITEKET
ncbi:TetR/AcrR family transcriptional regulator [Caldimonas sp. KR1-144]|uniref:TetR/AcrR family transcriptional regulator n=1 Tax=Caldimonas sp. KR1-144 TaxID=3400911 RepID=UPI003BFC4AE5